MTSAQFIIIVSSQTTDSSLFEWFLKLIEPETLIQFFGVIFLIISLRQAYLSISANTYNQIMEKINNPSNNTTVHKFRTYLNSLPFENKIDASKWEAEMIDSANSLTNSYQIVAHMVERRFLSKVLFIENFSGTLMDVYNLCAPFIALKRKKSSEMSLITTKHSTYLRHDLERLGLQSWIYQINLGYGIKINLINDDYSIETLEPNNQGIRKAKLRIRRMSRRSLTYEWLRLIKLKF